jgi:hypothetical protein
MPDKEAKRMKVEFSIETPIQKGSVFVKEIDGKPQVIKVDNDLSMPTENLQYYQLLSVIFDQNMSEPLSQEARACILNIKEAEVESLARQLGLEDCMHAFKERLHVLRTLVQEKLFEDISLKEIERRMKVLFYVGGEVGVEAATYPTSSVSELIRVLHAYRFMGSPTMIYELYRDGKLQRFSTHDYVGIQ